MRPARIAAPAARERLVRRGDHPAVLIPQAEPRPAHRAGIRLRMEAAVERVVILGPARRAHHEAAHRGVRPVVGHRVDDAEPRTAVRAVGEGIAIAPIGRVANLGQAIVAGCDVGHHQRASRRPSSSLSRMVKPRYGTASSHTGSRLWTTARGGQSRSEPQEAGLEGRPRAFELREHALRGVGHPPVEGELGGEAVDEGPETDPLHRATHDHPQPFTHGRPRLAGESSRPTRRCRPGWCTRFRRSAGPD